MTDVVRFSNLTVQAEDCVAGVSTTPVSLIDTAALVAAGDTRKLGVYPVLTGEVGVSSTQYPAGDVRRYGAIGNGTADDIVALNAAGAAAVLMTALGGRAEVYAPAGYTFMVSSTFVLPAGVSLRLDGAIKAGAVMAALVQTGLNDLSEDCHIRGGGKVLCNSLADVGIDLQYTRHFEIAGIVVEDALTTHILSGNSAAPGSSYETVIRNVRCHRPSSAVPAGSIGIRLRSATDCFISDTVVVGAETGVKVEAGGHNLSNVHCWTRASTGVMKVGFDDGGNLNGYVNCYADCPTQYGWLIRNRGGQRLTACAAYNNAGTGAAGVDNLAYVVRFEHADPNAIIVGLNAFGQNSSSRFLGDISFATSIANVTVWGTACANVTTTTPFRMAGGNTFADLTVSSTLHMTGQAWLSAETQLLQTGATIPDFDNVADSSDGATLITTQGSVISSTDATRRVWRFRQSGTGKAGTGGIAFGNFDANDLLIHSLVSGQFRLDFLDYTQNPDTISNRLLCDGNGLSWNGGAQIKKHKTATGTWDPPSVAAGAQTTTTLAVSGVVLGDVVSVSFDKDLQGMALTGYVSGAGTVTALLRNGTAGAIDLASGTLRAIAWQY